MSNKNLPKLRFPEFRGKGEWKEKKLGKFIEEYRETSTRQDEFEVLTSARSGLLRQRDYYDNNRITERDNIGFNIIPPNYLTYRSRSDDRRFFFNENNLGIFGIISTYYPVFRILNGSSKFFIELLSHYSIEVGKHSVGTSQTVLSMNELKKIELPIPQVEEQQKIADCLSAIDELITAQTQKLGTLKTHKKGLMQQLFPAEGENAPKLRFPEFRDSGKWNIRELGEFITERNQSPKEKLPLFSLTIDDGVTPKTARYERSFLVSNEDDAYKLVLPDDFAYNPMNLRFGAIGRHSGTEKVTLSKYYNIFYCDKTVNSIFCEIYFKTHGMMTHYDNMATGSLIEKRRVHFSEFLKFTARFPLLSEQQKIADCLGSVDELISAQIQKLDALKAHKKGLMQQLFPSADEVDE